MLPLLLSEEALPPRLLYSYPGQAGIRPCERTSAILCLIPDKSTAGCRISMSLRYVQEGGEEGNDLKMQPCFCCTWHLKITFCVKKAWIRGGESDIFS